MPKKKVKEKSEQQILLEAEYRRVRRNTKQNIRRLAARGYDVSGIKVPKIPEKITPGSIRALERINEQRYPKAKFTITEIKVIKGEEKIVEKRVSGTKGREVERKISAQKGVATKKQNKANKEARIEKSVEETTKKYSAESLKSSEDIEARRKAREERKRERQMMESWSYEGDTGISDEDLQNQIDNLENYSTYREETPDETIVRYSDEYTDEQLAELYSALDDKGKTDYYNGEYSFEPSSGAIKKTSELTETDKNGKVWTVLTSQETAENIVKKALEDLDVMIQYTGTSETGKRIHGFNKVITTQNNAQMIKEYIIEHLKTEPDRVVAVLRNMMDEEGFHTVDYMYSSGGYQRFLKYYNSAFVFQDIEDED